MSDACVIDADRIQRRKAGRERAKALVEFINGEVAADPEGDIIRETLAKAFGQVAVQVVPDKPMTESEAVDFERRSMPFGVHASKQIKTVPLSYLLWLEGEEDFRRQLRRYLRSARMQQEQEGD